jgi:hypothetical protein
VKDNVVHQLKNENVSIYYWINEELNIIFKNCTLIDNNNNKYHYNNGNSKYPFLIEFSNGYTHQLFFENGHIKNIVNSSVIKIESMAKKYETIASIEKSDAYNGIRK